MIFGKDDIVECVDGKDTEFEAGSHYIVAEGFRQGNMDYVRIKAINGSTIPTGYLAWRFKMVTAHCTCPSHILLWGGCACGASKREMEAKL